MPRLNLKSDESKTHWLCMISFPALAVLGSLIFLYLTYHSFLYTQYIPVNWQEVLNNVKDHPLYNVLALLTLSLVMILCKKLGDVLSEKVRIRVEWIVCALAVLWVLVNSILWIMAADRVPEGDQAFIYGGASYFMEGNYAFLQNKAGYCQIYPQQLGQIAVVELIFHVVGAYNYFAIEVLCAFCAAGIVLLGFLILGRMKAGFSAKITYCLLMMGCVPLIAYTSWVYGDLPSTFFLFLTGFLVLRLQDHAKWYIVAGVACSYAMACLVRKNSMIFLVAFFILALIDAISRKRWRMIVAAVLALSISLLSYQVVYKTYEYRSGSQIGKGLPINSWIVMGMQENWNGMGWYNNFPKEVAAQNDWDYDAVEEDMKLYLRERISAFLEQPGHAMNFFKSKLLSQWNVPLFESLFFSSRNVKEGQGPAADSFVGKLYYEEDGQKGVLFWADRWHFLVLLGLMLYFAFAVRSKGEPMEYLFAVTIVGGFFFSALWEAKARYALPYYLMAMPLAVMGYAKVASVIWDFVKARRGATE